MRILKDFSGMDLFMMSLLPIIMIGFIVFIYHEKRDRDRPEAKVEYVVLSVLEKVSVGEKYITVAEPVSDDVAKILKDEHYEAYLKLPDSKKIIYKKIDKVVDKSVDKR